MRAYCRALAAAGTAAVRPCTNSAPPTSSSTPSLASSLVTVIASIGSDRASRCCIARKIVPFASR